MDLRFKARLYTLASGVTIPCAVHWAGEGWQEPASGDSIGKPGRGTWFQVRGTGFTPLTVGGGAASGSVFEGFGMTQDQPAPAPGWKPLDAPFAIQVTGTGGEVTFRHIMMLAITRGINATLSGRLKLQDLRGQWFVNAVTDDRSYDTAVIDDVRAWPYWSQDPAVLAWQQDHYDHIVLGRVDDVFMDRIFALAARSVLKLQTTLADPGNPAHIPGGSPTNLMIGSIRSDFTKWTIWNTARSSAFDDVSVSVATLVHQGEEWGKPTPLPGSAAIRNDGTFTLMTIGSLKADMVDRALVQGTSTAGASNVEIGRAIIRFDRSTAGSCYLQDPGTVPSNLYFALPPAISAGRNTVARQTPGATGVTWWPTPP